ncbi:MAG: T9SS type A sorting domain-containing protein, partial [Bacteroidales bacterium]
GEIVSATWTNNSGTIKLYRVSNQSPFCRTLVQTLNVNQFDPNNLTIAASGSNNYHPHCEQHFFTTYNGENYLKGEDYNWSIIPNSVGSVVENNHQYNAVVVLNHTTDTLYDQQLQLKIKKCGVEHVKIKTFDVFYIPVPFMFAIDDHFCEGVPKTIALTNFNLFDSLFYFYEEGKYPINGPNFTCSFNNTTHDITFGDITAVGYVCGAAYINLRNSWTIYPKPDIKITPNNQISYCHNEPHNIPLIITSPDRITHYQWYRNEEIIPGATDSIYIPEVEGSYYMIATGFFNCLSKSNAVRVTIDSCSGQEPDYTVVCDFSVSTTVSCNMISAEISPPDFDDLYFAEGSSSGGEITLISSTGNHGEYRVTDPGQYYISGGVSNENPACESRFRKLVTVPVIPSCAVSFSCDSNRSLTYCLNTSKALPNFPIDYQLILDGIPIDTIYRFLVPGSTHTLQVTSNYNNQICSSEVVTFTVPTISADFAVNRSPVCQDVPVTLTPLETENIILYYWKFGNDGIFKLKEATCTYQIPGFHEVTLIVIDQYGCVDSSHYSIDVRPNNLSGVIQPDYAITACQGASVVLTCEPAGENPITYLWDDLQDTSASVHVNHSGIYHVTLTDDLSCHTVVSSQNVTVIPFPQVHITGTTNVCEHDRIDLSGYCGSGYRYSWSQIEPELIENISSSYGLQLDHAQPGHYLFQLTVSPAQNSSCSHTDTISVNVTPLPNPPYISLTSMSCHPYSAQLDLSPIDSNGIYRWSNGKSGSTIHVDHGGPYCVYYTNQNGCTVQSPDISVPHSPEYYFWTFPTGCYYFCTENLPVTVYGPVWFPIVEQWRWKWMRNGNFINGGSTPSYNENGLEPPLRIPKGGVYQLSLANEFCDEITGNMNVTEVDCKKCNIQLTSEQQYEYYEEDKSVTLNITIEHPYTTDWNYSIQSLSGYPVLPSSGILYNHTINQLIFKLLIEEHSEFPFSETIELIMWNPFDETMRCTYIFKFTVTADHIILQPKKHTILPKETEEEDYFYLYPNPANTHCTLAYRFTEEGDYTIFIRDLLGKELLKRKIPEQSGHILVDLSPYNRGLYFIECRQHNQLKKVLKIVKN